MHARHQSPKSPAAWQLPLQIGKANGIHKIELGQVFASDHILLHAIAGYGRFALRSGQHHPTSRITARHHGRPSRPEAGSTAGPSSADQDRPWRPTLRVLSSATSSSSSLLTSMKVSLSSAYPLTMSSLGTPSPVSASTFRYLMRGRLSQPQGKVAFLARECASQKSNPGARPGIWAVFPRLLPAEVA